MNWSQISRLCSEAGDRAAGKQVWGQNLHEFHVAAYNPVGHSQQGHTPHSTAAFSHICHLRGPRVLPQAMLICSSIIPISPPHIHCHSGIANCSGSHCIFFVLKQFYMQTLTAKSHWSGSRLLVSGAPRILDHCRDPAQISYPESEGSCD